MFKKIIMAVALLLVMLVLLPQGMAHAASYDNQDAHATGCFSSAYHVGRIGNEDASHLQIWWSRGCSTNFAEIQSPDGNALLEVELQRAQQSNVNCNQSNSCTWNDFNEIITCSTITFCAAVNEYFDPNKIPFPAKTWETNMLYAPNQMVRVRVETDCPGTAACWYQSSWH